MTRRPFQMVGQTATLGRLTLALQAACLLAAVGVFLVEHLAPGAIGAHGLTASTALQTIGQIAVGGGVGGGMGTVGHGLRHYGTRAPTTAMYTAADAGGNPPDPDADLTVPS